MKRAVIYARFSCSKQREASIADQIRECHAWCEKNDYTVVAEYSDYAVSGLTDARPGFQKMIANAGESDVVVVYMMDRFSRDIYDAPIYKKMLRDKGVKVVSATEVLPDSPDSILLESIYEAIAAMESAKNSKRTKRGMEGKALKGLYTGDRVYGYRVDPKTDRYVVSEEEAVIVREVFARRIAGESYSSIARDMSKHGVKTYTGRPCSSTMIQHMIKNPRYKGTYKWGNVEIKDGMPAIVTEKEWVMAQMVKPKKNRKTEIWDDYLLSSRTICACGANSVGVSGRGSTGKKYSYYRCAQKCGTKAVPKEWLETHVAKALRELVADREAALEIGRIVERYTHSKTRQIQKASAEKRVREAKKALVNIQNALEQGISTPFTNQRIEELQADLLNAETELEAIVTRMATAEDIADFLQFAGALKDTALVNALTHSVVIGDDEIYVVLNYDVDGQPKTISMKPYNKNERTPDGSDVRTVSKWLPTCTFMRTHEGYGISVVAGRLVIALKRVA